MADTYYTIYSGFYDSMGKDRLYSADDMNRPYKSIISEGIFSIDDDFAVVPSSGMVIQMKAGVALLGERWIDASTTLITVPANAGLQSRTDSVILQINNEDDVRAGRIVYRTGVADGSGEYPGIIIGNDNIHELILATVTVAAGATSIAAANITSKRGTIQCPYAKFIVGASQIEESVESVLADHPEWTTTIQDGSITMAKLNSALASIINGHTTQIADLNNALGGRIVDIGLMKPILESFDYSKTNVALTFTEGKIVSDVGTVVDNASSAVSNKITLENGNLYHINAIEIGNASPFVFYDADNNITGTLKVLTGFDPVWNDYYFIASQTLHSCILTSGLSRDAVLEKITITGTKADIKADNICKYLTYEEIPFDIESGKILNGLGVVTDYPAGGTSWNVSEEIDISGETFLKVKAKTGYGNSLYALYDSSHTCIYTEKAPADSIADFENLIFLPSNAHYIIISKYGSNTDVYIKKPVSGNKWNGKRWVCIGDSLTEENAATTKHYFDYIADITGITPLNYGVGGTGYINSNGSAGNFTTRMASVPTDADVYTIFGSFNDVTPILSDSIPFGNASDSGTSSVCGYINGAIDALLTRVPMANLGIVAPCPWVSVNPVTSSTPFGFNYVEALRKCCERRSIPFLDLYTESGMRPWDATFVENAYSNDPSEGIHPDETGHAILAPKFKAFLESLLM